MDHNEVIKYPILSEKTYAQMENHVYTFAVDFRANKAQVKKVVEFIFDVKVEKVNIMTVQKKPKKLGRFEGFKNRFKKAVVTLKDGQKINIFPEEAAQEINDKDKKDKKDKKEDIGISAAEQKAADKIAQKLKAKEEQKIGETKDNESNVAAVKVEESKAEPVKKETKTDEK
ncbi:50S ribosomal protein L23 [Candidatus Mycoplasma mahonii]|uniref:50S ribosomal protein L23 n=1 Tax=Candidatus Mycoplasma mahonii TaxID=3004105 RepID=UPI0026ED0196|nr:50S ribosomal protein L23 [Candidatus Mycoplasma mahonii]WKX02251.1 50S ribosomal protein L23 [Candidatus Mycoplasma mahonii]